MPPLSNQVAIITGASSGIGAATARAFGQAGCKVVLAARRLDRIEDLAAQITTDGGQAIAVQCDVSRRNDVARMVELARSTFGGVHILINNAGVMPLAPMTHCRMDEWDETIDINLKGVLNCIGHVLPILIEQGTGHIVNISSVAGRRTFPAAAVYCATKHAVHALSESLRSELAQRAVKDSNTIRVTIIAPGSVDTELLSTTRYDRARAGAEAYFASIGTPLQGEEIAESILYALNAPAHVNVNEIVVRPVGQIE